MADFQEQFGEFLDDAEGEQLRQPAAPASPFAKSFGGFLDRLDRERETASRATLDAANAVNPDLAAKAAKIGQRVGLSPETVEGAMPELEREARLRDQAEVLDRSPRLKAWMSDLDNARVAHDDLEKLSAFERYVTRPLDLIGQGYRQGAESKEQGRLGYALMAGDTSPETRARLARIDADLKNVPHGEDFADRFLYPAAKIFGQMIDSAGRASKLAAAGGVTGAGIGALATGAPTGGLAAPVGAVPGFLAGAAAGFGAGFFRDVFVTEVGSAYLDMQDIKGRNGEALDPAATRGAALFVGLANAALESLGAHVIAAPAKAAVKAFVMDGVKSALANETMRGALTGFAKHYAEGVTAETATEVLQEGVNILAEDLAKHASNGDFATLENDPAQRDAAIARLLAIASETARGMAVLGVAAPGANFAADMTRVRASQRNMQVIQALGDTAQASKLRERLPEKFRDFVRAQMEGGQVENVFVPADQFVTYFQSNGFDPNEVADELGGVGREQLGEAIERGGDLVIPLDEYAAKIAPTEHHAALAPDLRFHPGDMTAREAAAFNEEVQSILAELAQQQADDVRRQRESEASPDRVYENVRQKLVGAGRGLDVAAQEAAIWRAFFKTMGERAGVDPFDLYSRFGVQVQGSIVEGLKHKGIDKTDLFIERLRNTKADGSDRQLLGPSLLEFIAKRGGIIDTGGDLAAMDADKWHREKKFRPKLIRPSKTEGGADLPGMARSSNPDAGFTPDDVALAAWEAGYLPEFTERPTVDDLFEAIRGELAGRPVHSAKDMDEAALAEREAVEAYRNALSDLGIDLATATNAEVKDALNTLTAGPEEGDLFQGEPVATLTGEELGEHGDDLKALRQAARQYYREHLKGTSVENPSLGKITFGSAGEKKTFSNSANADKLKLFPALPDILAKGDVISTVSPELPSNEAKTFHWIEADVSLDGRPLRVGVMVREDANGNFYYNHNAQIGEGTRTPSTPRSGTSSPVRSDEGGTLHQNIVPDGDGINMVVSQGAIEDKRGAINFGAMGPDGGRTVIKLFERADLSTFMHESGHFFLEVFRSLAEQEDAPAPIREDWAAVLQWLGATPGAALTVDQHEQWARGFEAYLFEGKAPSVELRSVFQRMKAWLLTIYRHLRNLNVSLSDEVRGVMDRMLATEEEISAADEALNYRPLFGSAEEAGMTQAEFGAYLASHEKARRAAEEDLLKRALTEITRERARWWRQEREKVRAEVEREVNARPVYLALHWLSTGEMLDNPGVKTMEHVRLSRDALVDGWGEEVLKLLPRTVPPIWTKKGERGGVHPDHIADIFGFSSGDELVQALMNAHPRRKLIETETETRMRERHGDMLNDGRMQEEAIAAVHGDERAAFLHAELRALNKRAGEDEPTPAQQARAIARDVIARKRVKDAIAVNRYTQAEAKAARAAQAALAAGDLAEAARQKRMEVLNHYLAAESQRVADEVDKAQRYMARFQKARTIGTLDQSYLEQIQALLDRYEFRRVPYRRLEKRESLAKWVADQEAKGLEVNVPEALLDETRHVNYRLLTVEELRGLVDTVKNIEHLGRLKKRLLLERQWKDFDDAVTAIVGAIEHHAPASPPAPVNYSPNTRQLLKSTLSKLHADHTKLEFLFRRLDGFAELGPVWTALFKPFVDAESREQQMMGKMVAGLQALFGAYSRIERALWGTRRTFVPEMGKSFTKAELLAIGLNWGNEGNRQALVEGFGLRDPLAIEAALRKLDARDWTLIQGVWDLINTLWPDIAKLQRDLTGVAPEKVEPLAFEITPQGSLAAPIKLQGGYYPLKYDPEHSHLAFTRQEKEKTEDLFGSNWLRPATKQGHTKERVGSRGQRVRLDLGVLTEHLQNVIHDITHRRALIDTDRLIQDERVRDAIETAAGKDMYRLLRPWLVNIAGDRREPSTVWEKVLMRARAGASIVAMGWKITTAIVQPLGYLQTVNELGPRWAAVGLRKYFGYGLRNPWHFLGQRNDFVLERSAMMRHRRQTFDRDVRDVLKRQTVKGLAYEAQHSFFYLTGMLDMAVAVPTWLAAYEKGMHDFAGDEGKAIDYADKTVRMTQGSGGAKDLARVQTRETLKLFTMFYSYFSVLYNQFAEETGRLGASGRKGLPRFAAAMFFLWFAPSILGELVAGRGPDDGDDWKKWALRTAAAYPFQAVVGLRDVAQALFGDYGYSITPAADALQMVVKTSRKLAEGEVDRQLAKDALMTVGYWAHLPSRQMWITGEAFYDWLTGSREVGLRDLFFPRKQH